MGSTGPQVVDRELTCPAMEELMTTTGPSHSLEDSVGNEYPYDLGEYARPVTTAVAAAGTWVNRGLVWTFGFNHEEAVECFQRAIDLDPDFANFYPAVPYPGTELYNKAKREGLLVSEDWTKMEYSYYLLKGNGLDLLWGHIWPMVLFTVAVLALGLKTFRKTLD